MESFKTKILAIAIFYLHACLYRASREQTFTIEISTAYAYFELALQPFIAKHTSIDCTTTGGSVHLRL